jgi:hypothetical protein
MTDGSGRISPDSFAYYDRATRCWKTSQESLPLTEDEGLVTSLPTWPMAGTMRNGTAYPHLPLVPRTSGTASSSSPPWPTPTARDHKDGSYCPNVPVNGLLGRTVWEHDSSTPPLAASGSLNPTWVEWLMGFPSGWTVLKVSATPSSRRSPNG